MLTLLVYFVLVLWLLLLQAAPPVLLPPAPLFPPCALEASLACLGGV